MALLTRRRTALLVLISAAGLSAAQSAQHGRSEYCDRTIAYEALEGQYTITLGGSLLSTGEGGVGSAPTRDVFLGTLTGDVDKLILEVDPTEEPRSKFSDAGPPMFEHVEGMRSCVCGRDCACAVTTVVDGKPVGGAAQDRVDGSLQFVDEWSAVRGMSLKFDPGEALTWGFASDPYGGTPLPVGETGEFPVVIHGNIVAVGSFNSYFTERTKETGFRPMARITRNDGRFFTGYINGNVSIWGRDGGAPFTMSFRVMSDAVGAPVNLDAVLRFAEASEPNWRWSSREGMFGGIASDELEPVLGCELERLPRLKGIGAGFSEDGTPLEISYRLVAVEEGLLYGSYQWRGGGVTVTRSIELRRGWHFEE